MGTNLEGRVIAAIPHDKVLHALAGALVFAAAHPLGLVVAMAAVLTVGVAKEVFDRYAGGDMSAWDVVATACGGLLGVACSL